MAVRGKAVDGGPGQGCAESAVGGFERAKTALDIETMLGGGECIDGLAEQRRQPVGFGDEIAAGR